MLKKCLCMFLAAVMLAVSLPAQVFAQEVSDTDVVSVSDTDLALAVSAADVQEISADELKAMVSSSDAAEFADDFAEKLAGIAENADGGIMSYNVGDNEVEEKEKNDTRATANVIKNDSTVYGNLHKRMVGTEDKTDYFRITISRKSDLILVGGSTRESTYYKIYNSSGKSVAQSSSNGLSDGVYLDNLAVTLNAGTYYIAVIDNYSFSLDYLFYVLWEDYSDILESGTWGGIKWALSREGDLTISGNGAIPDAVYNESTELTNAPWAQYWEYIDSVEIKSGVTGIGDYAFTDCYYAKSITIADSVTTIGEGVFWYCEKITSLKLPANLKTIEGSAFEECNGLREITIPAKTVTIENYAFAGCDSLAKINVSSANTAFCSIDGVLYDKAAETLISCPGAKSSLNIPNGVKTVREGACLNNAKLSTLKIADSVTVIENNAFAHCTKLTSAALPGNLETIGSGAFYGCTGIRNISIPAGVKEIGMYAFGECSSLENINVDNANESYTSVDGVLYNSDVSALLVVPGGRKSLDIPDSVISIETGAFYGCNALPAVILPNTISHIAKDAFFKESTKHIMYDGTMSDWFGIEGKENVDINIEKHFRSENPLGAEVIRIAGGSRTQTAALISEEGFESAENVVLASGDNYADALAGGALAYALEAPILLVRGSLDQPTLDEIKRLGAKNIYILGGSLAISDDVVKTLTDSGYSVERIAGASRYDTAIEIAKKLQSIAGAPEEVYFAYAHNYPDALAISGIAAIKGCPVLYIAADGKLTDNTAEFVRNSGAQKGVILGGELAISPAAEGNILGIGISEVTRLAGASRVETCRKINEEYADILTGDVICMATAYNYPDALAGGVFAALNKAPMMLLWSGGIDNNSDRAVIIDAAPEKIYIFGGPVAVPVSAEAKIWEY